MVNKRKQKGMVKGRVTIKLSKFGKLALRADIVLIRCLKSA